MITGCQIPLHGLVLSLSEALDWAHPSLAAHQMRVAYIATTMAREMDIRGTDLSDILLAAAQHDIGLTITYGDSSESHKGPSENRTWVEAGYELLHQEPFLSRAAEIVRYLHIPWQEGRGAATQTGPVPLGSHILSVADAAERAIDRGAPVLGQAAFVLKQVVCLAGNMFHPGCVEAFRTAARPESFWLDCTSERVYGILLKQVDWIPLLLDEATIDSIAQIFARVADSTSPWTSSHSASVAATAVELARRFTFSPREQSLVRVAGHFHDLGKLTVPSQILDKQDKPTSQEWAAIRAHPYYTLRLLDTIGGMSQIAEWAAFHHERADGKGYPFRISAQDLTLGSRIMAVADVFSAITEDRPYRKAMSRRASIDTLNQQVKDGALDGNVVALLQGNYDEIDAVRRAEQASYAREQKSLAGRLAERRMAAVC